MVTTPVPFKVPADHSIAPATTISFERVSVPPARRNSPLLATRPMPPTVSVPATSETV